eukprot:4166890-Lingulodinium_polyedra.AAC.1
MRKTLVSTRALFEEPRALIGAVKLGGDPPQAGADRPGQAKAVVPPDQGQQDKVPSPEPRESQRHAHVAHEKELGELAP